MPKNPFADFVNTIDLDSPDWRTQFETLVLQGEDEANECCMELMALAHATDMYYQECLRQVIDA
jgi:hypothetical protein